MVKARLKDVAERAGVAKNTASMILNRRPNSWASKATVERVFRTAKELNYQPSRAAVAFRRGKTNVIGLVVPDLQNPFYSGLAEILETFIAKDGYDLVIKSSRANIHRERVCLQNIVERQVDGVVCIAIDPVGVRPLLEEYTKSGKAVVLLSEGRSQDGLHDSVSVDFTRGMTEVVNHLVQLGHHRIAFLVAVAKGQDEGARPLMFRSFMRESGLSEADSIVANSDQTLPGAFYAAKQLLSHPSLPKPTAIIAHNDLAALGVLRAASELGLRVPYDLSVVGVDNTLIGKYLPVTLTTILQPTELMMAATADLLKHRLKQHDYAPPQHHEFETTLVLGESTGRPYLQPKQP